MADALEQMINIPEEATPATVKAPIVDKYDEILEKIEDPNCPVADVSRLISIELAKATRDMARLMGPIADPTMAWKSKAYADHIKALRDLNNQLRDTEILSKKDMLNMDGAKFQFVLREFAKLYKRALKEAGVDPSMIESVMRQFADLMSTHDGEIRRELAKFETGKE